MCGLCYISDTFITNVKYQIPYYCPLFSDMYMSELVGEKNGLTKAKLQPTKVSTS